MELKYLKTNNKYNTVRQVLSQEFKISSRLTLKLKKVNQILLNDIPTYLDNHIKLNDIVCINLDFVEDNSNVVPTKMNLHILFEDDAILVIDKPAGIPIHPSMDHYSDSLSNGVRFYFDSIGLKRKIRPVNRLDRNTSGIVIFAKNEYIQECLINQMKNNDFKKEYIALCAGRFDTASETLNFPIARKANSIIERQVDKNGQNAVTQYNVISEKNGITKLQVNLLTGRTHQIRVHMAYIGHPLLGDDLYGTSSPLINRQALHAYKVNFIHPLTKKIITIKSELPKDMNLNF